VLPRVGGQQADEGEDPLVRGRLAVAGRQPAARVDEHDDVAALQRARARLQLADQHPVTDEQRGLHRLRRDEERLDEEGLDHDSDGERDEHRRR
jgi:hypothetical protein